MTTSPDSSENLNRGISGLGSGILALNGVIGAGIFAMPALLAAKTGLYSPFIFLISALLMLPIVVSIGQVAALFDVTGGPVTYVRAAFGRAWSFQVGWLACVAAVAALAANTNALLLYAGPVLGIPEQGPLRAGCIVLFWTGLAMINILGIRQGMRALSILTALKLLPLLLLLFAGLLHLSPQHFAVPSVLPSPRAWQETILLAIYAYVGFEGALVPAAETRSARRNIPRSIVWAVAGSAFFYFLLQAVCILNDPALATAQAPMAQVAQIFFGPVGAVLLTLAAVFSITGNLSAAIITLPRYAYSMGREGELPSWFGWIHERYRTPWVSIAFFSAVIALLACTGSFVFLAVMAALAKILSYSATILSYPSNSGTGKMKPVHILALTLCLAMIVQMKAAAWLTLAALMAVGALFRAGSLRIARKPVPLSGLPLRG